MTDKIYPMWRRRHIKLTPEWIAWDNGGKVGEEPTIYSIDYHSMVGPLTCEIDPCKTPRWNIVTTCPCNSCTQCETSFIGGKLFVSGMDFSTMEYNERDCAIVALEMSKSGDNDYSDDGPVANRTEEQISVPLGSVLLAVYHETESAPAGTTGVSANLYLDGSLVAGPWSGSCSPSASITIGNGVAGESIPTNSWEVDVGLMDGGFVPGIHTLVLMIEFLTGTTVIGQYGCRYVLRCGPPAEKLGWRGEVSIITETTSFEDCGSDFIRIAHPETSTVIPCSTLQLLGPYKTKADAEYVMETWGDFIRAYAETCVCRPTCASGVWLFEKVSGGFLGHTSGGYDHDSAVLCETGWTQYSAGLDEELAAEYGMTITPTFFLPPDYTRSVDAPWSGLVPPCWNLSFAVSGIQEPFYFDDENPAPVGGAGFWPLEPSTQCCTEDDESEFYQRQWGYIPWDIEDPNTPPEGIPATEEWLANYREYLAYTGEGLIASMKNTLIGELPEGLV